MSLVTGGWGSYGAAINTQGFGGYGEPLPHDRFNAARLAILECVINSLQGGTFDLAPKEAFKQQVLIHDNTMRNLRERIKKLESFAADVITADEDIHEEVKKLGISLLPVYTKIR